MELEKNKIYHQLDKQQRIFEENELENKQLQVRSQFYKDEFSETRRKRI